MKKILFFLFAICFAACSTSSNDSSENSNDNTNTNTETKKDSIISFVPITATNPLRAPAFPLITIDPYTSAWSITDNLYGDVIRHWTNKEFPILGVIKVDSQTYRFMGTESSSEQNYFNLTATQTSVTVLPMQTIYTFKCGFVTLKVTFTAPLFLDNLDLLSRPVNYISYEVESLNKQNHDIKVYFQASPLWALESINDNSTADKFTDGDLAFVQTGNTKQAYLNASGDDIRINWGYFYMAGDKKNTTTSFGTKNSLKSSFIQNKLSGTSGSTHDEIAIMQDLGKINKAQGHILVGYDDVYSIQYFRQDLRPYWNRNGDQTIKSQFHKAQKEYVDIINKCNTFDNTMMKEATTTGGAKYADLCALAYRQSITAHKLVQGPNGDLLFLPKENNSNGCIGTVDVIYPSSPLYLYYNPKLAEAQLNCIFYYSESGKWTKPFAAHDIGQYPLANGQVYGGDMPIEESGNMLIQTAAIAAVEGNADYANKHWSTLTTWVEYLVQNGLDPANQLCTDDFAGHLAHNANLSIKAILAIASYGYLAKMLGKTEIANQYTAKAKDYATQWKSLADDGDHYRLAFDRTGTWSLKYNLVWDTLLKLNIFDPSIITKEFAYYQTKMNVYGIPLDNRRLYTKTDWIHWTFTMSDDQSLFEKFITPIYNFMNETNYRIPMSDWIYTDTTTPAGFKARSVVGGYFIKMLKDKLAK
jgi:hypothetical protein